MVAEPQPLIEASRVKFAGMTKDSLDDPPALDQVVDYRVRARCKSETAERMKDGEVRKVSTMEIVNVEEIARPDIAETEDLDDSPQLFDDEEPEDTPDSHTYPAFSGENREG